MKLEVKNIKHARFLSEETNAFSANLFVDGRPVATCSNDGKGGCTNIHVIYSPKKDVYQKNIDTLKKAEAFAKTLPGVKSDFKKNGVLPMDLEFFVDLEIEKDLNQSEIKKALKNIDKKCNNKIIIISKKVFDDFTSGKSKELPYKMYGWNRPIQDVPIELIKKQLPQLKLHLKGDEFIYNKNLPI